jgi:tetratricopeptide (TPR) repeat protein
MTWWALSFDGPQWVKNAVLVGAAVVAAFALSYVGWVLKRAADRRRREDVLEQRSPETRAGLLRADRFIVPFTGRDAEYAELREWCRDDKPPVRLVVGAGGVGKTRLALHLGEYLKSCGWSVTVVAAGKEAVALPTTRAITRRSIFLIVDYAETRTDLVGLLRSVAGHPDHVRALLIARSVGNWWWYLRSDVAAVRGLVQAYPPLMLSAQVDSARRPAELVHAAAPHFAAALNVRAPTKIEVTVPDEVPLMVLHAAALLAVLRSQDHHAPAGQLVADLGVLDELLGHERRYWYHSATRAGLGHLTSAVLQRAVAVACLFGAMDEDEGAKVLRRVPDLRDDESLRRNVARWLRQLYPPSSGYWGALQPELVAEAHVIEQLKECPELVMADLSELHIEQVRRMLTVLSMGATYQPAGVALLEQALHADIERLAFPALEVAKVTGASLDAALTRVLSDAPVTPETLYKIEEAIPYPTTVLARTAVAVTRRILHTLPADAEIALTAHWHLRLGVVLAQAGHADEAMPHIETAVKDYRALVGTDRDRYLPGLARSLHNLGIRYVEQGRHADALPHTEQAVEYYRELVVRHPGHYRADLAASLNNLGLWLAELGRHPDALAPLQEAVEHYWELVETDPARHRRDLVQALTNLGLSQSHVPRYVESLPRLEEVVERNRSLTENDRDRYLPELARSSHELGNGYAESDRREEALYRLTEALSYYRALAESLDQYRPEVAACLNDLGVNLTELGRYADARPNAEEAVELLRRLTEINPARFRPELARALDNLVFCLSSMHEHLNVLAPAEEAITLYRRLTTIDPDRYRPELARALTNRSVSLSELRRHAEALPESREAVAIYWDLLKIDPRKYAPLLARALRRLAVDYSGLSRHAEADQCRQDADLILEEEAS